MGRPVEDGPVHRDLDDGYVLDDDRERIDRDTVHAYLSEQTYWALGRERAVMDDLFDSAWRLGGLYRPRTARHQVGFARVVSDGHTVSYLADVYVLPEHRGRGLGLELVRFVVDDDASGTPSGSCTPATCTRSTPSSASSRPPTGSWSGSRTRG